MANYAFNSFLRGGGGGEEKKLLTSIAELTLILKVHERADSEPDQE